MKKDYLEIVDSLIDAVDQCATSSESEMKDPWIQEAMRVFQSLVSDHPNSDELEAAAYDMANAYSYHSILYGIHVAQALQAVSRDPAKLGKYILECRKAKTSRQSERR